MINPFKIKKVGSILLSAFIPAIMFIVGSIYYGFYGGLIFMGVGTVLSYVISVKLLDNPFRKMLEGKGIMTFPIDSSGIMRPFIMNINLPFITGKYGDKEINDTFNRKTVHALAPPIFIDPRVEVVGSDEEEEVILRIKKSEFNAGRFQLNQYPLFFFNQNLNSVLTKEMLSKVETTAFAEHTILNLNRKVEELGRYIRDFARYAVETMRPRSGIDMRKAAIWIVIILVIIAIIIFAPTVLKSLGGGGAKSAGQAVSNAVGNVGSIVPR